MIRPVALATPGTTVDRITWLGHVHLVVTVHILPFLGFPDSITVVATNRFTRIMDAVVVRIVVGVI